MERFGEIMARKNVMEGKEGSQKLENFSTGHLNQAMSRMICRQNLLALCETDFIGFLLDL